ncbi:flippase [Thermococcus aciditolerans]|uniref:Flippase n=1 Tax=Thermococcus aciditolerans TaxID=2598455 RepID=A0A5C0SLH8_9EURY|nr:flippase [Thermococcus aciditolerans]QEK15253.1 flippase [Thermococcus aciditolerans]
MSEASQALQRIARGTGIIFAGTVISMLLGFISRMLIARHYTVLEYGVFNLALTVIGVGSVIAKLGFNNSLPREVAFYREKEPDRIDDLISTAMSLVAMSSVLTVMAIILSRSEIADALTRTETSYQLLKDALKMITLALPFTVLTGTIISATQGFGRVREKVYFQNIIYPILWTSAVVTLIALSPPFSDIFWAYMLVQFSVFALLLLEVKRLGLFNLKPSLDLNIGRHLVAFSIPLMFTGILSFIMNWTDTLMLGYYKGSEIVGIYNAATPLVRLIPLFLNSAAFLYSPMASGLYARGKLDEMKRIYQVLTKWIFMLTLPIFSVMFLFPEATIRFIFGSKYLEAVLPLQILALGFMFHTFLGPNGLSLIVIGDSRFIMVSSLVSAGLNVLLNALLIPSYGLEGAAMATAVSYFAGNILSSVRLYQRARIHPFSPNYVKPLIISLLLLGIIRGLKLKVPSIWYAVLILALFVAVYFLLVLISRSIDKEDIELLLAIEKRLGVDLGTIKRVLRRFV